LLYFSLLNMFKTPSTTTLTKKAEANSTWILDVALVMAFYEQAIEAMAPRTEAALAGATSLEERIAAIMAVKFAQAIATKSGGIRVPENLAPFLPKILWLYQMGLILHWIYDRSPDQRRTRASREKSLALLVSSLNCPILRWRSRCVEDRGAHCSGGGRTVPDLKLIRLSIAMVWLYQDLCCKVLGGVPSQEAVISTVPFIGAAEVRVALMALGLVECGLAVWVLSGQRMRQAATVQTARVAGAGEAVAGSPAAPAAFDGFSLSNIGDGATPDYLCRLRVAIDHAAVPNAIVVTRTFAEPGPNTLANWAPLDRSLLWGVVEVSRAAEI
jgi:hypothetical protein